MRCTMHSAYQNKQIEEKRPPVSGRFLFYRHPYVKRFQFAFRWSEEEQKASFSEIKPDDDGKWPVRTNEQTEVLLYMSEK